MKIKATYYIEEKVLKNLRKLPRDVIMSEFVEAAIKEKLQNEKSN